MKNFKFNIEYPFNNGEYVNVHWYYTSENYLCRTKAIEFRLREQMKLKSKEFIWYLSLLYEAVKHNDLQEI